MNKYHLLRKLNLYSRGFLEFLSNVEEREREREREREKERKRMCRYKYKIIKI